MKRTGPLAGYRILEMVGVGPGPFAAMWFSDMGAEVIRIDRPGQRDNQTRKDVLNRGRPSLALNLKAPGAVDVMMRLVERADGLIEGFRPGVMERLGLGPDACLARNPKLVYGPYASEAGHDINYIALTGALSAIGPRDGRPVPPLNLVGDFGGGGMLIIAGMLAALLEREKSGRGQVVDAAMYEGAALLTSMMWGYIAKGRWKEQREANLFDGGPPFYGTYRCSDGGYVALGNIEAEFWSDFLDRCGIDDPDLRNYQKDEARWPELRQRLDVLFASRPRDEWCAMVEGSDACLSPVLDWSEAPRHPLAKARGAFTEVAGVTQPAPTPKFSRTPGSVGSPPPLVGEHTREVLARFEFSADEIERLIRDGVVDQA